MTLSKTRTEIDGQADPEKAEGGKPSGQLVTVLEPGGAASEAYRALRTNLLYAQGDVSPAVIVVTSPGAAEGKSTLCANLGVVMAQADKRTLVVDCNLRKPAMHEIFGIPGVPGLVDVLTGGGGFQEACQEPVPGLKVLPAGHPPADPAGLLGSRRLSELLDDARGRFDHVLVDSSPVGLFSEPAVLAIRGDGVLLTLDARKTRKEDARRAVRGLTAIGAHVIGTVINNAKATEYGRY